MRQQAGDTLVDFDGCALVGGCHSYPPAPDAKCKPGGAYQDELRERMSSSELHDTPGRLLARGQVSGSDGARESAN